MHSILALSVTSWVTKKLLAASVPVSSSVKATYGPSWWGCFENEIHISLNPVRALKHVSASETLATNTLYKGAGAKLSRW